MIIITGASKGIGKFLMKEFETKGEKVFGNYFTTPGEADQDLAKVNITDYAEVKAWIDPIIGTDKKITLINCAGSNYNSFAHKSLVEKWGSVIDVNVKGTFNLIQCVLPKMRENKFGRIINFSSVVAQVGTAGTSAYAASKAALWGMSKSIAAENANMGITINNLNLGYFNIGMIEEVPANFLDVVKSKIPAGDLGNPADILRAVQFLMDTDYMTGSSININGGLY